MDRCYRCQATSDLRLEQSILVWNEKEGAAKRMNVWICKDGATCAERIREKNSHLKNKDLWANYNRQKCRPRRYTPRRYWDDGKRLTFALAQAIFRQSGMTLEQGRSDFPLGIKSGYIIDREWRFKSLLDAIEIIKTPHQNRKTNRRKH